MYFLLFAAFLVYMTVKIRYYLHMLQLNSYINSRFFRWMKGKKPVSPVDLLPLLALACLLLKNAGEAAFYAAAAVLYLLLFFLRPRRAEKKPLVYTARVKRLFVTAFVLLLAAGAGLYFVPPALCGVVMVLLTLLSSLVAVLANCINAPVEKAIAGYYYRDAKRMIDAMPNLTVIGITGSYGKTSTKFILNRLLSAKYNVLMTPESYNTTMGVIRTIRTHLNATHEIFIVEMGAKKPGDIKEICDLVHPDYGIISSVGPQHLETFKTIDNVLATKLELADAVKNCVFLNFDNEYLQNAAGKYRVVSYATRQQADFMVEDMQSTPDGSDFVICHDGQRYPFHTRMLGRLNVTNILAAVSVCKTLGVEPERLNAAIRSLEPVPHRLQLIRSGAYTIIDDAFNANPLGSAAALETLSGFDGCRIVVTPGMVELGSRQDELNFELGKTAAACCDYVVLVGIEQTKPIARGAAEAGFPAERLYAAKDLQDALSWVNALNEANKIVLLENDLPDNFL